jgi:hypothetical protein
MAEPTGEKVSKSLVEQVADRHVEFESLMKVAAGEWKKVTQPDRTQEWRLSILLVVAVLTIAISSALLSAFGRFGSDVAFVMGTALGAFAAILKDFLLPVAA